MSSGIRLCSFSICIGLFHSEVSKLNKDQGKYMIVKRILQMLKLFSSLKCELYIFNLLVFNVLCLVKYG